MTSWLQRLTPRQGPFGHANVSSPDRHDRDTVNRALCVASKGGSLKPQRPPETGVFETGSGALHSVVDRLSGRFRGNAPKWMRSLGLTLAVAVLTVTSAVFRSPGSGKSVSASVAPTPTPSGQVQPLTGRGPFVVWTLSSPDAYEAQIYGLDLSAANGDGAFAPVLVGRAHVNGVGMISGQRLPAPRLPIVANDSGTDRLFVLTRGGMKVLDPSLQFPQDASAMLLGDDGRSIALLVNGDNGMTVHIQDLAANTSRDISVRTPSSLLNSTDRPFVPGLVAWYDHQQRFLVTFTNGGGFAPIYSLDLNGTLTALPWLNDKGIAASGMLGDQSSFIYGQGHDLTVVDVARHSIRTVRRLHENDFAGATASPDGSRVAYTSGSGIEVASVADGRVLQKGFLDGAPNVYPLAWVDNQRLIAAAYSTDLITGQSTQALLLFDARGATGEPPTVFFQQLTAGGQDMNFLGLLT
jgi:hypothetical protein